LGDTVEGFHSFLSIPRRRKSLGMKDRTEERWSKFIYTFSIGVHPNVKVDKLMDFRRLCEIVHGVDCPDTHLPVISRTTASTSPATC
jgi:4-hydroxy-3-methylbut-2-enyl diphosphate reductase